MGIGFWNADDAVEVLDASAGFATSFTAGSTMAARGAVGVIVQVDVSDATSLTAIDLKCQSSLKATRPSADADWGDVPSHSLAAATGIDTLVAYQPKITQNSTGRSHVVKFIPAYGDWIRIMVKANTTSAQGKVYAQLIRK